MSLAPPGTLARRRQQAGVDAAALKIKTCPHTAPQLPARSAGTTLYRCAECGALRAIWERQEGAWVQVWCADGA